MFLCNVLVLIGDRILPARFCGALLSTIAFRCMAFFKSGSLRRDAGPAQRITQLGSIVPELQDGLVRKLRNRNACREALISGDW
jgi:hypothetical protein